MHKTDPTPPSVAQIPSQTAAHALESGARLGPYLVVRLIGRGGMGEVYAARDERLGRGVAVKVLPAGRASDAETKRRFEIEARAAATINHPNVTAVYDVGTYEGAPYVVSELLIGETLRMRLARGPLRPSRAVDIAQQIALGLAAAHEHGVIHRDLKPENLFLTTGGQVKILDFGVAKLLAPAPGTDGHLITNGVVGTTAYMSPEQLRGRAVDARSDVFSLGIVLYELLAGERPFRGQTPAEIAAAVLSDDAPPIAGVPGGLAAIIGHCLDKEPADRFHSARDLAFALQAFEGAEPTRRRPRLPRRVRWAALAVVAAAALVTAGYVAATRRVVATGTARYQPITFPEGWVNAARFAQDSSGVFYQAHWQGRPEDIYFVRPGSPESRPLGLPPGTLLAAVSATDELAVLLDPKPQIHYAVGTLALVPSGGGAPRPVEEAIIEADFAPGREDLAFVRGQDGFQRLEFPRGRVLVQTPGTIAYMRFAPKGDRIAFALRPVRFSERGRVVVVDLEGKTLRQSVEYEELYGLGWRGDDVWFTAGTNGQADTLRSLDASGKERSVATAPTTIMLYDVAQNGHFLLADRYFRHLVFAHVPGATGDRDLSWLDQSELRDVSQDGASVLIDENGRGAGESKRAYLRSTAGGEPLLLGTGDPSSLATDGKTILRAAASGDAVELVPTGAGAIRRIELAPLGNVFNPAWVGDGPELVVAAVEPGHAGRIYLVDAAGHARAISPDGVREYAAHPVSPDGKWVVGFVEEGQWRLVPTRGGEMVTVAGMQPTERIAQWTDDGHVLVWNSIGVPGKVARLDPWTGAREAVREIVPPTGNVAGIRKLYTSRDGATYAYSVLVRRETLYLGEGL
jgi:hypothetical protein